MFIHGVCAVYCVRLSAGPIVRALRHSVAKTMQQSIQRHGADSLLTQALQRSFCHLLARYALNGGSLQDLEAYLGSSTRELEASLNTKSQANLRALNPIGQSSCLPHSVPCGLMLEYVICYLGKGFQVELNNNSSKFVFVGLFVCYHESLSRMT